MTRRWKDNRALVHMIRLFLVDEVSKLISRLDNMYVSFFVLLRFIYSTTVAGVQRWKPLLVA